MRIHDRPFHFSSMAIVESEARDELQPFQPNGGVSTPANASDPGAGAGAGEAIRQLKFEQASLARREKELSKQIRNETRKRSRLRESQKAQQRRFAEGIIFATASGRSERQSKVDEEELIFRLMLCLAQVPVLSFLNVARGLNGRRALIQTGGGLNSRRAVRRGLNSRRALRPGGLHSRQTSRPGGLNSRRALRPGGLNSRRASPRRGALTVALLSVRAWPYSYTLCWFDSSPAVRLTDLHFLSALYF